MCWSESPIVNVIESESLSRIVRCAFFLILFQETVTWQAKSFLSSFGGFQSQVPVFAFPFEDVAVDRTGK